MTADEALQRLMAGNERFLRGEASEPRFCPEHLADIAKGQRPFATLLGCADSRVSPEHIFDVGLGELFVIRVAGNVFSPEVVGSMQYAVAHLKTPLVMVLGHEGCGAVHAAMEVKYHGGQHLSRIQQLVDTIVPGLPEFDPAIPADAVRGEGGREQRPVDDPPDHGQPGGEGPPGRRAGEAGGRHLRDRDGAGPADST